PGPPGAARCSRSTAPQLTAALPLRPRSRRKIPGADFRNLRTRVSARRGRLDSSPPRARGCPRRPPRPVPRAKAGCMTRVLIVDDQPDVRAALAALLRSDRELELVGLAQDAEEAVRLSAAERPDVAL